MSLNEFIAGLLTTGTVTAVLITIAYLFRDSILTFITSRIEAKQSRDLARLESELRSIEASNASMRQYAFTKLERLDDRLLDRRMAAVEAVWHDCVSMQKHRFLIELLKTLEASGVEKNLGDAQVREFINLMSKNLAPDQLEIVISAAKHRPFISSLGWAYFQVFMLIYSIAIITFVAWRNGAKVVQNFKSELYLPPIKKALPHHEVALSTAKPLDILNYIDEIEEVLLSELRASLEREGTLENGVERAEEILSAVTRVRASQATPTLSPTGLSGRVSQET